MADSSVTVPRMFKDKTLNFANTKHLIREIESEGGGIANCSLRAICEANTDAFGESGSDKRRCYQRFHEKVKRLYNRSVLKYVEQLQQASIEISEGTQQALEEFLISEAGREKQDEDEPTAEDTSINEEAEDDGRDKHKSQPEASASFLLDEASQTEQSLAPENLATPPDSPSVTGLRVRQNRSNDEHSIFSFA